MRAISADNTYPKVDESTLDVVRVLLKLSLGF